MKSTRFNNLTYLPDLCRLFASSSDRSTPNVTNLKHSLSLAPAILYDLLYEVSRHNT
ncbi:hypothetical protein IFO70_06565 [Phormidium tenue FACHB-886]|nr:hypothetical protein [Phormidium tenue FACHB-886]